MSLLEKEFNFEEFTYEQQQAVHNALAQTTVKHITHAPGLFTARPYDLAANHSQDFALTHLQPAPTTREEVDFLAQAAGPDFYPRAQEVMEQQRPLMGALRILLSKGDNIHSVTTHSNMADVALFSAAYSKHLDQAHWQDYNGLIISRGVATIEAFGMAASQVVQKIGHVFMSFPRTKTMDDLIISSDTMTPESFGQLAATNNRNMRKEVKQWLGADIVHRIGRHAVGKTLHEAWEGKTAAIQYGDDHKPEHITLHKVHPGILDIIKHGYVLPSVTWDGNEPIVKVGELTTVKSDTDVARVQEWQRSTLAAELGLPDEAVTIK